MSDIEAEFNNIIDHLFGVNYTKQDRNAAFKLMRNCIHPDVVWFKDLFSDLTSYGEAVMILNRHTDDARAWFFRASLLAIDQFVLTDLMNAAAMGHVPSQGLMVTKIAVETDLALDYANSAVKHGDRFALAFLGVRNDNADMLRRAAEKGVHQAEFNYTHCCPPHEYVFWMARACLGGQENATNGVRGILCDNEPHVLAYYRLGGVIRDNEEKIVERVILGTNFESTKQCVAQCKRFYEETNRLTRVTIDAWCCVARQLGVSRDIRRLVGEYIWSTRIEMLYKINS